MTFRLTMYPALDGDCILLSWGRTSKLHHILVDLGRGATYRAVRRDLKALDDVELFVMSHIDADHIAGAIPMVRESVAPFHPKRVWYNARPQLVAAQDRHPITEPFGARQGEKLARGIVHFNWPWNGEFESEVVSTDSPEARTWIPIADGLRVRLLSPTDAALKALLPTWDAELEKAHIRTFDPDGEEEPLSPVFERLGGAPNVTKLANDPYAPDRTETNGSAIAFIAEFEQKRVLLSADAHSEVLQAALSTLAQEEGEERCRLDLMKLSHHGSKANTSKSLPGIIDCTRFAISTDGSHDHGHPNGECVARLLAADKDRHKTFYFNYRQPNADAWDSRGLMNTWNYQCVFPADSEEDEANGTLAIDI